MVEGLWSTSSLNHFSATIGNFVSRVTMSRPAKRRSRRTSWSDWAAALLVEPDDRTRRMTPSQSLNEVSACQPLPRRTIRTCPCVPSARLTRLTGVTLVSELTAIQGHLRSPQLSDQPYGLPDQKWLL